MKKQTDEDAGDRNFSSPQGGFRSPKLNHGYLLQLLLDSAREYSVVMLDENGDVVTWAGGAMSIHGYSRDEIVGRNFSIFYTEEDRKSGLPRSILAEATANGRWEGDCLHLRRDGSQYWANVVVMPLRSDVAGVTGFAKVTRDISEKRRAYELLRSAQLELETRVDERTRELAKVNAELTRLAITDPLTGLSNRRQLGISGASEVARSHRYGHPLAACMIDVDHFKDINDTHGHAAGDAALVEIVRRIGAHLRSGDIFARLAGDEFVVLLIETESAIAVEVAQRLKEAVTAAPIRHADREFLTSISVGVAALRQNETFDDLLERADHALLAAKTTRNQVELG